jgi:O-antigen ligase
MNKLLRYSFLLIVVFEAVAAYLVSVGVWPQTAAWYSAGAAALFVLIAPPFEALQLVVFSIPFFLALPNRFSDSLAAWRLMLAWLFIVWFFKEAYSHYRNGSIKQLYRDMRASLFTWDKYIILFGLLSMASVLMARFKAQSLKQLAFLINIYLLYLVAPNVVKSKDYLYRLLKAITASLGIIVFLGYVQFGATLFSNQYYFWQYWAILISKAYYGLSLANVLAYSNSWFSYTGGNPSLRMFSIMPDSHSFGVICSLLLTFLAALLPGAPRARKILLWVGIALCSWALILSGTRGVWVGLAAPVVVAAYIYWSKMARPHAKRFLAIAGMVVLFFAASPLLVKGLGMIRSGLGGEEFLERVSSIYDLEEDSNAGRLVIWKNSAVFALRHPLGVGYGNFIVSLLPDISPNDTFDSISAQRNLRYNLPQKFVTAHSLYLNILVELGVIGFILFILVWLSYAREAWYFLKKHGSENNIYVAIAAGASFVLLWILAYGVFDLTLFNDKILMYSFLTLAIAGIVFRNYQTWQGPQRP